MAKRIRTPDDFDSPWKDALQAYLPYFLAFFFPDIHRDIDWSRGYEALDKEFQKITRRAKIGKILADKLFKVYLQDGNERWLLIHVEVQGEYEKEFPERMFDYHVAARQLYNQAVVSLAVLCDESPGWRPTRFGYEHWGCRLELVFRIAKVLDHAGELDALEISDNPFAAVVFAHLMAQQTQGDPTTRAQWKLRIVKWLYRGKWTKDDVRRLFRVIDFLLALPEELEDKFWNDINDFEEETNVEYITSVERIGMKRGFALGVEKGIEKGIEKGARKGLREGIGLALNAMFGVEGVKLVRKTRGWDAADLRGFARFLKKAKSLDEVREYLA